VLVVLRVRGAGTRSLGLGLVLGAGGLLGCGAAEEAREAVLSELAVGSWACARDDGAAEALPFTVRIKGDGTFGVAFEAAPADEVALPGGELTGTWTIEGGDLRWGFDEPAPVGPFTVPGFDDLDLESEQFTLENPGLFGEGNGLDEPADEEVYDVEAHDKDSVTFSVRGGDPWTCDRQG
jgi:hypothetical protein